MQTQCYPPPPRACKDSRSQTRSKEDNPWVSWALTSTIGLASWIVCETVGGLLFLALGLRLWAYHITPICWQIASLSGWAVVFVVLGVNLGLYHVWEKRTDWAWPRRWLYRSLFVMIAGPINEVVFNTLIWRIMDQPLYQYTFWPTFHGSGSYLSPLYYLTLLLGFWLEERIPKTLARNRPPHIDASWA